MVTVISLGGEFCRLDIIIRLNSFLFRADTLSRRYGRILSDLLFSPILVSRQMVKGRYLDEFCCFFIISFKQQCEYIGNLKILERAV